MATKRRKRITSAKRAQNKRRSKKISKLIREGYPQKQAVAIAYSYENRRKKRKTKRKSRRRKYKMMSLKNMNPIQLLDLPTEILLEISDKLDTKTMLSLSNSSIQLQNKLSYKLIKLFPHLEKFYLATTVNQKSYILLTDYIFNNKLKQIIDVLKNHPQFANIIGSINKHRTVPSTPLLEASKYSDYKTFAIIFGYTNKETIKFKDNNGNTALHYAAMNDIESAVYDLIMDNSIPIDDKNNSLKTPLIIASIYGHEDIIRLLVKNGANTFAKDKYKKSAFDYNYKLVSDIEYMQRIEEIGLEVVDGVY